MFRFTIRDVLWLTVVVALAVGWWVEKQAARKTAAKNEELLARVAQLTERAENAEHWVNKWRPIVSGSSGLLSESGKPNKP